MGSTALAWSLGLVTFWFPGSRWLLGIINDMVVAMLTASQKGTLFLLGPLALGPGQTRSSRSVFSNRFISALIRVP